MYFQLIPSPAERMKRAYKRNYKTYSYEQLVAAYLYVKEKKVAVKFAARAFGVPPSTLNDRVQGKVFIDTSIVMNNPKGRKILPQPSFNKYKVQNRFFLLSVLTIDLFAFATCFNFMFAIFVLPAMLEASSDHGVYLLVCPSVSLLITFCVQFSLQLLITAI